MVFLMSCRIKMVMNKRWESRVRPAFDGGVPCHKAWLGTPETGISAVYSWCKDTR